MIAMILFFAGCLVIGEAAVLTHDFSGGSEDHHKATSYQNIHMEHFHAVPTYVKKEFKHLLEHPIAVGKSSSNVEIHHGGKHDQGYAIENNHHEVHKNDFEKDDHESSHLLLNEEYSPDSSNYEFESNSQDVVSEDNEEHQESDQSQMLLHHVPQYPYKYIPLASREGSVGHGSPSGATHYQPVMYVLKYQNENYEKPVHEH